MRKIILFSLLLTACTRDQSYFETILTENESCWVFYNYPDEQKENVIIGGCNQFYANGTFEAFIVSEGKLSKSFSLDKDVGKNIWSFSENDSLLDVGGHKFRIIKYCKDTIEVENENDHIQKFIRM
jgi:hypothetical protein